MQYDPNLFSDSPAPTAAPAAQGKMDDSLFSDQPAPSGKSFGGFASNAVKNAGEIVQNTADLAGNMISHPIDTSSQVVKGLPGAIGVWAKEIGIPEALHGKFGEAVSKFGNSAYEHPVSRALDVASVALPALKGAGLVGEGAEAASAAGKAGEMGKVGELAQEGSNALGRRELGFTKRLINTGDKLDKANESSEWANKNGLMDVLDSSDDRISKAKGLKDQAWNSMSDTYNDPALAGKNLNAQRLVDKLNEMRPRDARTGSVLTGGDYELLNNEIDKKIETIKAHNGDIPWESAQQLKNTMKGATKWDLTQPSVINDLRKRLSGAFRGDMDSQLEEAIGKDKMGAYNTAKNDYGNSKNIIRALDNKISSSAGNRLGGATDWLAGGAGMAHGGPLGGLAVVAVKKAVERYGLAAGSKLLSQVANGKYAGIFNHMTTFGPAEMATINTIASQDPQFAQELTQRSQQ